MDSETYRSIPEIESSDCKKLQRCYGVRCLLQMRLRRIENFKKSINPDLDNSGGCSNPDLFTDVPLVEEKMISDIPLVEEKMISDIPRAKKFINKSSTTERLDNQTYQLIKDEIFHRVNHNEDDIYGKNITVE